MNIHIMPIDKFTNDFVNFINSNFDMNSQYFYLYNAASGFEIDEYNNVKIVDSLIGNIDCSLLRNKCDKFFIHSFWSNVLLDFLVENIEIIDFDKIIFISWGGDIYNNYLLKKLSEENREQERKKKILIPRVKHFMTFACADYDEMERRYGANGKQYDCLYPSSIDIEYLNSISKKIPEDKKIIQVGNSATFTNQHKQILDKLVKYKECNIEIMCPLSYGPIAYRDSIIEYGKELFGDKFRPITEYMSPREYVDLLNSVDIAMFNNNRQQATANIEILSYLGKKLFLRNDTTMWKHYVERDKRYFYDIDSIDDLSFEELCEYPKENALDNAEYFKMIWDMNHLKALWNNMFEIEC